MSQSEKTERQGQSGGSASRGGPVFVELIRLTVVVMATAAAFEMAVPASALVGIGNDPDAATLVATLLGAAIGYVVGGMLGRFSLGRIDAAEERLSAVSSSQMLTGFLGGAAGLCAAASLTWPVLLFDGKHLTVPMAVLMFVICGSAGLRIGLARGGDLLRYLGASGRLAVSAPSRGAQTKVVDTSALIDGRILDVCRSGFLDGTLVLPRFVLYELQGLADSGDEERRERGKRGLDVLAGLQRSSGVALEVTDRDYLDVGTVDGKLVAMARDRGSHLVTVDANLGRVAEVQGVKVLNLNTLAETLRPPVLPGDVMDVRLVKPGKEPGQGVGYLSDGTMVVVEDGRDRVGQSVAAEVTGILSNPNGRMVFATAAASPTTLRVRAAQF